MTKSFGLQRTTIIVTAVLASALSRVEAQSRVCKPVDPTLGPTGYMARGARCEGILEREVGGEVIPIVGLAAAFEKFDAQSGVDLTLAFSPSTTDSIWIVATSVRPTLHYRMDTAVPKNIAQAAWPVSVLRAEEIRPDDIAVLAWTTVPGIADRVYVPIALTQSTTTPPQTATTLTLLPAKRARAIRVSTAETDSLGNVTRWVKENDPVPGSDFIEGQPVTVRLPALQRGHLYRVRIGADLTPTSTSTSSGVLTTTTELLLRSL